MKSCMPCQFKSMGWLSAGERRKCESDMCPTILPKSCGLKFRSARSFSSLGNNSFAGGIWIAMMGNSILRGVYVHAVAFLTKEQGLIVPAINPKNHHRNRYLCCTSSYLQDKWRSLANCTEVELQAGKSLADTVADEMDARRSACAASASGPSGAPICVSWQWAPLLSNVLDGLTEFSTAHARTGVRPASISINPGLHILAQNFILDAFVRDLRAVQASPDPVMTLFA